jgi:hypothetical protein
MLGRVQVAGSSAYGLRDWKISYESASIVCRPTPKNLMWRFGAILAALLIIVPMSMSFGPPWNPITRADRAAGIPPAVTDEQLQEIADLQAANRPMYHEMLGAEKLAEIEKKAEADQSKRNAERAQRNNRTDLIGIALLGVYWIVFLFLVWLAWLFGLLPVIRYPFECVRIERSGDELVTTRSRVFGRAVGRTAIIELSHLSWGVRKQGGTINAPARWVWHAVAVTGASTTQLSHWPLLEFELEAESSEPDDYAKPPGHTRLFLKALSELTELAIVQPTVERRSGGRVKMRYNATSI